MAGFAIVACVAVPIDAPSRSAVLRSKPTVYIPWRSKEVATTWPSPVRPRATSAAQIPAASAMPAPWSPIPPRWKGGSRPGAVRRCAIPERAQKAPMSYAARLRSGPSRPNPVMMP